MATDVSPPDAELVLEEVCATFRARVSDREWGALKVLDGISAAVQPQEFVTLIGPSGCGKTTLFEIIGGLRQPTSGAVRIRWEVVRAPRPEIGIVFQEDSCYPWRTTLENVEFGLELRGESRTKRRARALAMIELVGLSGFERHYPRQLSGGMRQRVAIARALANDPEILLMDEPFGALDQQTRVYLGEELLRIWEATRKTILFITHDISEAVLLSDRVWVLSHRPSRIKEEVRVDIPRPRDAGTLTTPRFHELTNHIWDLLRVESQRALRAREQAPAAGGVG
jgi:NitT/TauT family transport system ATP-binding protein